MLNAEAGLWDQYNHAQQEMMLFHNARGIASLVKMGPAMYSPVRPWPAIDVDCYSPCSSIPYSIHNGMQQRGPAHCFMDVRALRRQRLRERFARSFLNIAVLRYRSWVTQWLLSSIFVALTLIAFTRLWEVSLNGPMGQKLDRLDVPILYRSSLLTNALLPACIGI